MELFKENIQFFSRFIGNSFFPLDVEKGKIEICFDEYLVIVSKGGEGELQMEICLGCFLRSPAEIKLKELASANFLGSQTEKCSLSSDEELSTLNIRCTSSAGTSPEENWSWLHRLLFAARRWSRILSLWPEFLSFQRMRDHE